jgi:hypothetical protein
MSAEIKAGVAIPRRRKIPEMQGAARAPTRNRPNSEAFTRQLNNTNSSATAIDFAAVNAAALAAFPAVLARILPGGKRIGAEVVALNPRRNDRHLGSFKVNRYNGRWADFATGDKGGDPISLVAYLADVSQVEAARLLARMLDLETGGRRDG